MIYNTHIYIYNIKIYPYTRIPFCGGVTVMAWAGYVCDISYQDKSNQPLLHGLACFGLVQVILDTYLS